MRTNIVLDEQLVAEAFKYAKVKTKRELVDLALREFIQHHCMRDVRELKGKVQLAKEYDYKALRRDKDKG